MMRPLFAVLLAGRIRPSSFSEALDIPIICLPIGPDGSLLNAWLRELCRLPRLGGVRVVVNTAEQVKSVGAIITASCVESLGDVSLDVIAEPAAWRGAGGIVRDSTDHLSDDVDVLVCEAKRLPPSLAAMIECASDDLLQSRNLVGICNDDEPAGTYLFMREAIKTIPAIGYFDLKEQFIPALVTSGKDVFAVRVGDCVLRIHDLDSYLECVRFSLEQSAAPQRHLVSKQAFIASSAVLSGHCIIEDGAVIEERAVIHDSVVLWGATIGAGAVINRCVIGSSAIVPGRSRLARITVASTDRFIDSQAVTNPVLAR